ncbi:hypothetical protein F0919_12360 [Taibaiella lutea]|uniref:Uncharacterized protein n=1 Tax=Taibaiella lutea TaxID=2608001 RepID=A0A5M6CHC7_9BACT|nr:DUF6261 family protein [Taibaiella lutea]KAA5533332.1 hypothetical protein F0919_12360 [Taibaiella lutea]
MKLHAIASQDLQYFETSQFITRLFSDIASLNLDLTKDNEMNERFQLLKAQANEFYNALGQIQAMADTKRLEELDLLRDRKLSTIRLCIATFRYREEPEIKEALTVANIILSRYEGLEFLNYEAESKGIRKFLDEWNKEENDYHVQVLGLQLHLSNLSEVADAFDNVFATRSLTVLSKETYDGKMLKSQMLGTYSSLAKYILAMCDFKKDEGFYPPLLDAFNNGRKYYADLLAKRKGVEGKK